MVAGEAKEMVESEGALMSGDVTALVALLVVLKVITSSDLNLRYSGKDFARERGHIFRF